MPRAKARRRAAATEEDRRPAAQTESAETTTLREQIARRAYLYWLEGGSREGSAEEDWYRAERDLRTAGKPARKGAAA